MIEFERLSIKGLGDFIESSQFKESAVLPVSTHRALSYMHNPRAKDDDVVLYLAKNEGKIIAYRMILPDQLLIKEEKLKVGWFSCLFVKAEFRGSGIGKELTKMAIEDWKGNILYHDPVVASGSLYLSSGQFDHRLTDKGIRCFFSFNLVHLINSRRWPGFLTAPAKLLESFLNALNRLRPTIRAIDSRALKNGWTVNSVERIDDETAVFIQSNNQSDYLGRGKDELNWITSYPWILESDNNPLKERYYFSAYSSSFRYLQFIIRDDKNEIKAFCMLMERNKQLKLLYFFGEKDAISSTYLHILALMKSENYQTFSLYHKEMVDYVRSIRHPFWLIRKKSRPLFISKKLSNLLNDSSGIFQDGDGDYSFT